MQKIDNNKYLNSENRKLFEYKPLFDKNSINLKYGEDFNNWFSDRFFLRKQCICLYNLFVREESFSSHWTLGKEGWIFAGSIRDLWDRTVFTNKEKIRIKNQINELQKYCDKNNIQLFIVIAPDKSKVYTEYFPYNYKSNKDKDKVFDFKKYADIEIPSTIIYLEDEILKNKTNSLNEYLYYKTDTHWNDLGAYYAYKAIISTISENNRLATSNIKFEFSISKEPYSGDLIRSYRIDKKYAETNYPVYNFAKTDKGMKNQQRVYLVGDSYSYKLNRFLVNDFQNIGYKEFGSGHSPHNIKKYLPQINEFNTDILIVEYVENHLMQIKNIYSTELKNAF